MPIPLPPLDAQFEFVDYLAGVGVYVIRDPHNAKVSWLGIKQNPIAQEYATRTGWVKYHHATMGEFWVFENSRELLRLLGAFSQVLGNIRFKLAKAPALQHVAQEEEIPLSQIPLPKGVIRRESDKSE